VPWCSLILTCITVQPVPLNHCQQPPFNFLFEKECDAIIEVDIDLGGLSSSLGLYNVFWLVVMTNSSRPALEMKRKAFENKDIVPEMVSSKSLTVVLYLAHALFLASSTLSVRGIQLYCSQIQGTRQFHLSVIRTCLIASVGPLSAFYPCFHLSFLLPHLDEQNVID
jgi:hypothetical protein